MGRLDALTATVSLADWRKIVARAVAQAKAGSDKARSWLARYLIGKRPPDDEPQDRQELIVRIIEDEGWFRNDAHARAADAAGHKDNSDPSDDQ